MHQNVYYGSMIYVCTFDYHFQIISTIWTIESVMETSRSLFIKFKFALVKKYKVLVANPLCE